MPETKIAPAIEDLMDFYKYWPKFRPAAVEIKENNFLSAKVAVLFDWMIRAVDRVGPVDLKKEL